ncbi:hypothetical protein R1flu_026788 [Riccia fluitans]|uniref:Uncharacterized protein n=1 Tax=Riccia fluitans TaxID=41844 RepID=A0ABD1XHF9_9MARC
MLLETALADFSSDEALLEGHGHHQEEQEQQEDRSQAGATIPFSWDILQGKPPQPNTTPQSEYSGEVYTQSSPSASPDVSVHRYSKQHHPGCSSSSQNPRVRYYSGELNPDSLQQKQYSGELLSTKTLQRQLSGELHHLQQSRVEENGGDGPSAQEDSTRSSSHRGRGRRETCGQEFYRERGSSSSRFRIHSTDPVGRLATAAEEENSQEGEEEDMCEGEYEVVCTIPLEREAHQSNSDLGTRDQQLPGAAPAARLLIIRESDLGDYSNSSSPRSGPFSPAGRRLEHQGRASTLSFQQQQNMRLKVYPGDVIRISRMSSFQSSTNSPHGSVDNEVEKFYDDESPVSTLEQLPSPSSDHPRHHHRHRHSSSSAHGSSSQAGVSPSSFRSGARGSAARPNSSASASPTTEHRVSVESAGISSSSHEETPEPYSSGGRALRCLPSFQSSSLHSSAPPASNSSSSSFMASCLVALEVALRSEVEEDPQRKEEETENDFVGANGDEILNQNGNEEDNEGFLSLEESEGGDRDEPLDLRDARISRGSPTEGPELRRRRPLSHRWAVSNSQFEPEYHTMDFFSESEDDSPSYYADRVTSEATSSPQGSEMYRDRHRHRQPSRHSNDLRSDLDDYSWGDERVQQEVEHGRMNSWADDDMSSSEFHNMSRQHEEVFWDDQQSEMNSERAEEVIRGAVEGLRFTYSPVSSAFVFTRPENSGSSPYEVNRQLQCSGTRTQGFSPPNTIDTEGSQRFSISLDYATSVCSEDSLPYSMTRSSYVTELGLSRAESWSRVQRGAPSANAAQQYPSGLVDHKAGGGEVYGVVEEEESSGELYQSPETDPVNMDHSTQLVPKRSPKKSRIPTCLGFRSILRTLKAFSPKRSRLGPQCPRCQLHQEQSPSTNWSPAYHTPQMAVESH